MKKIVLTGNPNVGKSLIFSRMTRIKMVTANYAGTTVEMKVGKCKYKGNEYEIIDSPGIYSLEEFSKTDQIALQLIDDADIVINIIDSTNLERSLNLTLELLQKKKPMVVCLNFWDDTVHKGISIDVENLQSMLGVPVIPASALRSEGISELLDSLVHAKISDVEFNEAEHWNSIGSIIKSVQKLSHRHHTLLERISDFAIHPIGGILTAIFVLASTLFIVRFLGEGLIHGAFEPFYLHLYNPILQNIVKHIPISGLRELLVGNTTDPLQSFGILTSGVYIALVSVFPYFFSFYLVFGFLEDFGYLPRLSVVLDKLFHHLGLHGYSSIPVMLGLGCKVPAFMATRSLTNRREKILTITLIFMSAPCLSQSAMIVSLGMNYGVLTVITIYAVLIFLAISMNVIMNKFYRKEEASAEFFTEFPACRIPSLKLMFGKLWLRIVEYFAEVLPMIAVGVMVMNVLNVFHVLSFITEIVKWPAKILFGLPADIAPIMLLNFLRKDASVALLIPLNLTATQFICACIFLTLSTPCVASFFTMIKELSAKTTLKITGLILMIAIISTTLLHLLFTLIPL